MKSIKKFETYSIITKEEKVKSLSHNIMANTLALEITTPLPGYYGSEYLISQQKPGHIIYISRDYIHFESFFRTVKKMRSYLNFDFDAAIIDISMNNTTLHGIRIRHVDTYEHIEELQKCFITEGIKMAKFKKFETLAIIRIKKFLSLKVDENGIYHDLGESEYNYFSIPIQPSWKLFESITHRIRHNFPGVKFDVALGVMFRTGDPLDVIRVYTQNMTDTELVELRNSFVKALKEY